MDTLRNFGFAFVFIALIESLSSAPQHPQLYPGYVRYDDSGVHSSGNGLRDSFSQLWGPNYATDSPNAYMPPVVFGAMVPPVYEQSQFRERNDGRESVDNEIWELQRGRSDIDPIEDNDEFGYFYPRPKISFDLPQFTPLGGTSDSPQEEDATVAMTTDVSTTEKPTTTESATTVKL